MSSASRWDKALDVAVASNYLTSTSGEKTSNQRSPRVHKPRTSMVTGETYSNDRECSTSKERVEAQTVPLEADVTSTQTWFDSTPTTLPLESDLHASKMFFELPIVSATDAAQLDISLGSPVGSPSRSSAASSLSITPSAVPATLLCNDCTTEFTGEFRKGNLDRHRRWQPRNGPYQCNDPSCHRTFKRESAQLEHYRKHHFALWSSAPPPTPRQEHWGAGVQGTVHISNFNNRRQYLTPLFAPGDRPRPNYGYDTYRSVFGSGLSNEGESHHPGYDYGEYQPSFGPSTNNFNHDFTGIGGFDLQDLTSHEHVEYDTATEPRWDGKAGRDREAARVAGTRCGFVDAEAQQLRLGNAKHWPDDIDLADLYYDADSLIDNDDIPVKDLHQMSAKIRDGEKLPRKGATRFEVYPPLAGSLSQILMEDDPWTPLNLRMSNLIRTSDHNQVALPKIGPFGPRGPGAEYSFKGSLENETEISVESEIQVIDSLAGSQPNDAFSSTLPTSRGVGIHEPEGPSGKQAEADLWDSATIYSLESAPGDERYISAFAHRLLCDLRSTKDIQDLSSLPPNFIVQTLKDFARRLYEESTDPFQWGTSVVLHKKRDNILNILTICPKEEETKGDDAEDEPRVPFIKSKDDMSQWLSGISADIVIADQTPESGEVGMLNAARKLGGTQQSNEDRNPTEGLDGIDFADVSSTGGISLPQLPDYESFIAQSNAYQWLLSRMSQHDRFSSGKVDAMISIEDRILGQFRAQGYLGTMSRSRPQALAYMTLHLEWGPREYMISLGLDPNSCSLDTVLCLTGTQHESQAMSVAEYLRQTWPTTFGIFMVPMLQLVTLQKGNSSIYQPTSGRANIRIKMARDSWGAFTISIMAGAQLISDFAQQLAWLAATLRTSPYKQGLATCCPRICSLTAATIPADNPAIKTTGVCHLSFDFECLAIDNREDRGLCWASMLQNPILVTGFPILRRPDSRPGLEVSLSTMASLVLSNEVVQIGQRIIVKSFNMLLIAVLATTNVMVWHCLVSADSSERISYFDCRLEALDLTQTKLQSLRSLETMRHIVGWCSKATDFCGHATANLDIAPSGLRFAPPSIVIDRLYIEGGFHVIGGMSVRINQKDPPAKVNRDQHVSGLLKMVLKHPFAFYDVTTRRSWLVDGVSALLHLVRISLHLDAIDDESTYDEWVFDSSKLDENWNGCNGRSAALDVLKSLDLRNLPVYVERQSVVDGQKVKHFSTFGDRVDKILHLLEVLIDRERDLASHDGVKVPQTRDRHRNIIGFDILDLTEQTRPVESRIAPLSKSGYGWSDMYPHLRVITIFGRGFGELIHPNDRTQTCTDWQTVPVGQDYMAVTTSTLKLLHKRHFTDLIPNLSEGELTDNTLWASTCPPLEACRCVTGRTVRNHLDPAQFLYCKRFWTSSRKPKNANPVDIAGLNSAGAVIFSNTGSSSRNHRNTSNSVTQEIVHLVSSASSSGHLGQTSSLSASASNTAHTNSSVDFLSPSVTNTTASSAHNNIASSMTSGPSVTTANTTLSTVTPIMDSATIPTATSAATPSTRNVVKPDITNSVLSESQQGANETINDKKKKRRRKWTNLVRSQP